MRPKSIAEMSAAERAAMKRAGAFSLAVRELLKEHGYPAAIVVVPDGAAPSPKERGWVTAVSVVERDPWAAATASYINDGLYMRYVIEQQRAHVEAQGSTKQ